ncbi:hypothetical protein ABZS86_29680 [Streptomyces sp. NPDC005355]|uniref:hypothetical protein n=1 Tax=Streptomyces sp. NPDC005355 TaxID=3157038 RepID=UPI0033BCD2EC
MRRRATSAFAASVAAALLLAGCGGGDGKKGDDKIAGAQKGDASSSAAPSKAASGDENGPEMTFPKDFKMVLDWERPTDAKQAAALDGATNFVRGIRYGTVKQDSESAAYKYYSSPSGSAQMYAKDQIEQNVKGGWTLYGTDRYTQPKVRVSDDGRRSSVTFCQDQSKMYSKEVKSGKVLRTKTSDRDYSLYEIVMELVPKSELWVATSIEVQGEAKQCKL